MGINELWAEISKNIQIDQIVSTSCGDECFYLTELHSCGLFALAGQVGFDNYLEYAFPKAWNSVDPEERKYERCDMCKTFFKEKE